MIGDNGSNSFSAVPVVVTGTSGFIGSHLVEHLLARGARVTALARTRGKLAQITPCAPLEYISCDIADTNHVEELISELRPQVIFHFAACPDGAEEFERSKECLDTNLAGTVNLLEAFRRWPGKLFVYGDSCKVYGDAVVPYRSFHPLKPRSSYAITKAAGWQFCELYHSVHNVPVTSVRPTMIYGPRQSFNLISYVVESVLRGVTDIRLDGGSQTRDPLFIEDAINAILELPAVADRVNGKVVNIGGGHERTVAEIASIVVALMEREIPVVSVAKAMRPTDMHRSYCDNMEAKEMIGWHPRYDLTSGLRLTIADIVHAHAQTRAAVATMAS